MFKKTIISFLFFMFPLSLSADDGFFGGSGDILYPLNNDQIIMKDMDVIVTLTTSGWHVECNFIFENTGSAVEVQMGFPDKESGETHDGEERQFTFENFHTYVNGLEVENTVKEGGRVNGGRYNQIYSFKVFFEEKETKRVKNIYDFDFSGVSTGDVFLYYVLKTGALWKGPIGHARFLIQHICADFIVRPLPYGDNLKLKEDSVEWEWYNFEPEIEFSIDFAKNFIFCSKTMECLASSNCYKSEPKIEYLCNKSKEIMMMKKDDPNYGVSVRSPGRSLIKVIENLRPLCTGYLNPLYDFRTEMAIYDMYNDKVAKEKITLAFNNARKYLDKGKVEKDDWGVFYEVGYNERSANEYYCMLKDKYSPEKIEGYEVDLCYKAYFEKGMKEETVNLYKNHPQVKMPYNNFLQVAHLLSGEDVEKYLKMENKNIKLYEYYVKKSRVEEANELLKNATAYIGPGEKDFFEQSMRIYGLVNSIMSQRMGKYGYGLNVPALIYADDLKKLMNFEGAQPNRAKIIGILLFSNLARNEIFARNGYLFDNKELGEYFKQFEWYKPKVKKAKIDGLEEKCVEYLKGLGEIVNIWDEDSERMYKEIEEFNRGWAIK